MSRSQCCIWLAAAILMCGLGVAAQAKDSPEVAAKLQQVRESMDRGAAAVPELIKWTGDSSSRVRACAAYALGQVGPAAKPAAEALTNLLKDEDPVVRRYAVRAIGAIRPGPEVMIPLFVKAMQDSDQGVQMRMLEAVTNAGKAAVPGLIKALDNPKAAYWACVILRGIGPDAKEAVPALTKQLSVKDLEIPRAAALALGAIGPDAASAAPALVAALDNSQLREAATFAIGQIGSAPESADAKLKAGTQSTDRFLSTLSYWTLARLHPGDKALRTEATKRIAAALTDKEPFIRAGAARALASLPPAPEITIPILEGVLKDADPETIRNVLGTLSTLGPMAVPKLIDALKHQELRDEIAVVLGNIGPAAAPATEALAKLVTDEDPQVAVEATVALAKIGPAAASAVPALSAALDRQTCPNVHAIAYALGSIGPAAVAAETKLHHLAASKDRSLAAVSAWAVTRLHPKSAALAAKAVPIIEAALQEPLPESRCAAIEALASLGPLAKPAGKSLEAMLQDKDPEVRTAAAKAIEAIQGGAGLKP